MWQQWVNVILGLWVIMVPFLGMTNSGFTWSLVISGVVIAALGLWGASETASERKSGAMAHHT